MGQYMKQDASGEIIGKATDLCPIRTTEEHGRDTVMQTEMFVNESIKAALFGKVYVAVEAFHWYQRVPGKSLIFAFPNKNNATWSDLTKHNSLRNA